MGGSYRFIQARDFASTAVESRRHLAQQNAVNFATHGPVPVSTCPSNAEIGGSTTNRWSGRMSSHDIQTRPHDKHFNSAASLYRPDNTSIFRGIQDVHHEGQSEPARQCNGTPCLQQLEMLRHILCEA